VEELVRLIGPECREGRAAGGLGLLAKDGVEGFADGAQVLGHGGAGVCR
jgi:hypothetical protein